MRTIALSIAVTVIGLGLAYLVSTAQTTATNAVGGSPRTTAQPGWLSLLFVGVVIVRPLLDIVAWLFRTYTVYPSELVIDEGIFTRHHRVLPFARVQQVDLHRPLMGQLLGITEVRVSTAGESGATTVALRSLDRAEADQLRAFILQQREAQQRAPGTSRSAPPDPTRAGNPPGPAGPVSPAPPERELLRLGPSQLAMAAVTHGSVVVGTPIALVAGLWVGVLAATNTDDLRLAGTLTGALALALGAAAVLMIVRLGNLLIGHHGFTLNARGDDLHLRFGLLEVRQLTIPRRRVQQIAVVDNPLRRVLGAVSVQIHSATGSGGNESSTRFEIPLVPRAELDDLLAAVMGDTAWHLPPLLPRSDRARGRAMRRRMLLLAAAMAGPAIALRPGGLVLMFLAVLGIPWGATAHRRAGHQVTPTLVAFGHGVLQHRIALLPLGRLQSCGTRSSPWQRRAGLASFHCDIAADRSPPGLYDIDGDTAVELLGTLPRRAVASSTLP